MFRLRILREKKKQAEYNAWRQKKQIERGVNVRVFPSFWETAAKDYTREIKRIEKTYKNFNV